MSDAPERIWAFWTPDDFDDDATITAYETVQYGGQQYVRADRIEELEAENKRLREALEFAVDKLNPYQFTNDYEEAVDRARAALQEKADEHPN